MKQHRLKANTYFFFLRDSLYFAQKWNQNDEFVAKLTYFSINFQIIWGGPNKLL